MAGVLTRWEPFSDLGDIRARFDRMFEDLSVGSEHVYRPAMDVMRDNGNLVLRADIPGMTADDVKIQVEDDVITLSGEHGEEHEEKGAKFVRRERRWGAFERSMALPAGIDPNSIKAKTHDGVLEVTVPLPKESGHEPVEIKAKGA